MAFGGQTTAELGNTRSALAVWAEARSEMSTTRDGRIFSVGPGGDSQDEVGLEQKGAMPRTADDAAKTPA
jgi:hypothetical protein